MATSTPAEQLKSRVGIFPTLLFFGLDPSRSIRYSRETIFIPFWWVAVFLSSLDRSDRLALLTIPIWVALVFAIAFPGHFFMDDAQIVFENLLVYSPDLKVILTSDYWGAGENSGLYRPLTIFSFALNYQIFGASPWGYLLVNIGLHAGVSALLFLFLRRINIPFQTSWFAAALFAVHPIHGEAVIQIVGRSELLVALFVLTALILARSPGSRSDLLIILCYLGAILSKEHGVVLIALIPAVDLFAERLSLAAVLRKRATLLATLIAITVLWLLYRHFVVHAGIPAPASLDPYYIPLATVDAPTRILSALKLQLLYLAKLIVPYHLQGMYPQSTVVPFIGWSSLPGITVVALVAALVGICLAGWKKRAFWALAMVLYGISFSPTSNLFVTAGFTMAERVVYLPSLWYCAGIAAFLSGVVLLRENQRLAWGVIGVVVCLYALSAIDRFYDFREPERYWQNDLQINPRNELSMIMLADYYRGQGRLKEAEIIAKEMTTIAPDFQEGLSIYAGILVEMDRPLEAIGIAKRAIALQRQGTVSSAKIPLAGAYLKLGRIKDTLETLQNVRITDYNMPVYWELYGKALEAQGDLIGALACYEKEATSSGGRAKDGLYRLGMVLAKLGRPAEAEVYFRRNVRINPQSASGWNALGVVLATLDKKAEASLSFKKAVELKPESREYRENFERSQ